jgi:hypothetical protein
LDWHTGWTLEDDEPNRFETFAKMVAAQEREAIMKSIEELNPVKNNPLLQNKPAAFWIENFRQIVYTRGEA